MKIALDVMGTDYGPKELVLGAVMAVKEYNCNVVLVGDEPTIRKLLKEYGAEDNPHLTVRHASEVIDMHEHPGIAVKTKKDASIVVATDLLRNKECDALVSSGSTGAAVAAALFHLGRIRGVGRPTIATVGFMVLIPRITFSVHIRHAMNRNPLNGKFRTSHEPAHLRRISVQVPAYEALLQGLLNAGHRGKHPRRTGACSPG